MKVRNLFIIGVATLAMGFCTVFGAEEGYMIRGNTVIIDKETGAMCTVDPNDGEPIFKTLIEEMTVVHGEFVLYEMSTRHTEGPNQFYWVNEEAVQFYDIYYGEEGFVIRQIPSQEFYSMNMCTEAISPISTFFMTAFFTAFAAAHFV